jgi:hypothetical protein
VLTESSTDNSAHCNNKRKTNEEESAVTKKWPYNEVTSEQRIDGLALLQIKLNVTVTTIEGHTMNIGSYFQL